MAEAASSPDTSIDEYIAPASGQGVAESVTKEAPSLPVTDIAQDVGISAAGTEEEPVDELWKKRLW